MARSIRRENEAASTLAGRGYRVEQNPPSPPGSTRNPDYRIEGEYFDCYAPRATKSPRGVWSELQGKVDKGQASRFVLNLDDWRGDLNALRQQFRDWPLAGSQETIVVRNGRAFPLFP